MTLAHVMGIPVEKSVLQLAPDGATIATAVNDIVDGPGATGNPGDHPPRHGAASRPGRLADHAAELGVPHGSGIPGLSKAGRTASSPAARDVLGVRGAERHPGW
jgi:hypothetical protein